MKGRIGAVGAIVLASWGASWFLTVDRVHATPPASSPRGCPPEMTRVLQFCVDRWEATTVDRRTGRPLSPYYPPHPRLAREVFRAWEIERGLLGGRAAQRMPLPDLSAWQREHDYQPKAVSRPGVVPQAYVSYHMAKRACENADKRLCTHEEWKTACRGSEQRAFPYGNQYLDGQCNVWGHIHPAFTLHDNSAVGHRDPRLNLLARGGVQPLLRMTGDTPTCVSRWGEDGVYDMVGNVDEWIADDQGVFVGGFYARSTSKGCESQVHNHSPVYHDYSVGFRCCRDAARSPQPDGASGPARRGESGSP